ncbi:MAG: hypothetical protein H0W62_00650 [Chitinophagales bacterium]|nr:hypothetical protein [Chitinophagales bacterium]
MQYNVYRSASPFSDPKQLTASLLLGFVRDNSAKNIRLSQLDSKDVFFKIKDNGDPLLSNQGLYAVTCTDNEFNYFAVTVTDLSTGSEVKKICLVITVYRLL